MPLPQPFLLALGSVATAIGGTAVAWYSARIRTGRLDHTLENSAKLLDFIERWINISEKLDKTLSVEEVKELMQSVVRAVTKDFEEERNILPAFRHSTSALRRMLLLSVPLRPILLPLHIIFYSSILFALIIVAIRIHGNEWSFEDSVAIFTCALIAIGTRVAVRFIVRRAN